MSEALSIIADLNAALRKSGQDIVLRRYTAPTGDPRPKTDVPVRAGVRPVRADQLIGAIDQSASNVFLSPTGLAALLPLKKGDKAIIQGRERQIEFVKPIEVDNQLVRVELMVLG